MNPRVLVCLALVTACHKKAPPAAFTGPLTFDRIEQARKLVHLRDDWDDAVAAIAAQAGTPTMKSDTLARWALADGIACAVLTIDRKGDHVTSIDGGKRFNKADFAEGPSTFTECEATAKQR
jgi:hypothetical protein